MRARPGTGEKGQAAPVSSLRSPVPLAEWNWTVGTVVSTFGRFGELRVRYETDFPERFGSLRRACLRLANGDARLFDVQKVRAHKGHALMKLAGVESIDDADVWRGASVQVTRQEAVALPEDAYYAADLVGMSVVTADGRVLGRLDRVLPYPAQDLFQIGEILLPAVKEFILEVDVEARLITVAPPDGLLPEEEPETVDAD